MLSDKLTFITAASRPASSLTPGTDAGVPFGGGYYAGANIVVDGVEYALVVAPKSLGGEGWYNWKGSNTVSGGATSVNDGWANTNDLNNTEQHPAAKFCRGLRIGGYDDWYLPSRDELEIIYRYLKPSTDTNSTFQGSGTNTNSRPVGSAYTRNNPSQTSVALFKDGGVEAMQVSSQYLSSTQKSVSDAWGQSFYNGGQYGATKISSNYVRAVRRVPV